MPSRPFGRASLDRAVAAHSDSWLGPNVNEAETPTGAPPTRGIGPWPYLAMAGGNAADLATTLQALASGRGREANPILGPMGPGGIAAMKVGSTIGMGLLMRLLAKDHPTAAKWLGYGDGAAMGGIAAHNYEVTR